MNICPGFSTVASETGQVIMFSDYLSDVPGLTAQPRTGNKPNLPSGQGEGVLIVDDEPLICQMTQWTLERYGYRAHTTDNGPGAIAWMQQHSAEFQVVIIDLGLSRMNGLTLAAKLKELYPELQIIATSGDGSPDSLEHLRKMGVSLFLPKPWTTEELLINLHGLMHGDWVKACGGIAPGSLTVNPSGHTARVVR